MSSISFICFLFLTFEIILCLKVLDLNEIEFDQLIIEDNKVIICKIALEKRLLNMFAKSYLKISDVNAIKGVYTGHDIVETKEKMSKWLNYNYLRLFINSSTINLPLYTNYCVGIDSFKSYQLAHHFNTFDTYNFIIFLFAITLFYSSNYLSKKIYIYYMSHVILGIIGSLLILTIVMHRFLPRKFYAFFVLSSFYLNTYFVVKIKENLLTYSLGFYLICYILVAGIISFSFAYYKGPIRNHRLLDLFKWFLQFISLLIILISSEYTELIIATIAIILFIYNLSKFSEMFNNLVKLYRFYFPKPIKLLSQKEYDDLGKLTTERELDKLRNYCKSPEFNKWKAMKNMHDASRFAGFIDGEDDVSDLEVFDHKSYISLCESQWTDDESDESINFGDL